MLYMIQLEARLQHMIHKLHMVLLPLIVQQVRLILQLLLIQPLEQQQVRLQLLLEEQEQASLQIQQ